MKTWKNLSIFVPLLLLGGCFKGVSLYQYINGARSQPQIVSSTTTLPLRNPGATPIICNPFGPGSGNTGNPRNGLQASMTYIPLSHVKEMKEELTVKSFSTESSYVQLEPTPIFLNQLNIPTVDFSVGFKKTSGVLLKDSEGGILNQYFSLHIDSNIMLNAKDPEGEYQFGILSDDGAVMSISMDGTAALQDWINNDGTHQNQLGCASRTIPLRHNTALPIHIDYFQGPLYRISLVLLWRLNPYNVYDPECGKIEADQYFFYPTLNHPSVSTPNYQKLLNRGWMVVPGANFYLPTGMNHCHAG